VLCADGLLAADLKSEFSRAMAIPGAMDAAVTEPIVAELEVQARAWLDAEDVAEQARVIERVALMRYAGQGGEIAVAYEPDRAQVEANFRAAHKALYGFNLGAPIELVTLRVHATGVAVIPPAVELAPGTTPPPEEHTAVSIEGKRVDVPVLDRAKLGAGAVFSGPVILTQLDSTTFVAPGWQGKVHASGGIILTKEAA
jgi:N-methylhydantoinase A